MSDMADVIFYNGDVITMDDVKPEAQSLAVKDGRILTVGDAEDVYCFRSRGTKMVDLNGGVLLPGFIEAHSHPITSSIKYHYRLNVGRGSVTAEDVWKRLEAEVLAVKKGSWILAVDWNPLTISGLTYPTRDELDAVSTDHCLVAVPPHGHAVFVNSAALAAAGLVDGTPDPEGGVYDKDSTGRLTGGVRGVYATNVILNCVPRVEGHLGHIALRKMLMYYVRNGFTTVVAMGMFYDFRGARKTLEELVVSPTAPVRIAAYEVEASVRKRLENYKRGTPGLDNFCPTGVKWWSDGSPYAGTMATQDPYLDTDMTRSILGFAPYPNRGNLTYPRADLLYQSMLPYHKRGIQLASHAHGERAVSVVLDAYEKLQKTLTREDPRFRIEHCGLITPEQLERAKRLGATCSLYIDHIYFYGNALRDGILGPERAERFMPLNDAKEAGHTWSLHSDSPASPLGPLRCIQTAVTRGPSDPDGLVSHTPLGIKQCVTVLDCLRAYTINAAWQIFHEDVLGSIVPGKIADFTVLSADPRKVDPYTIMDIQIMATYKSGRFVQPYEVKL